MRTRAWMVLVLASLATEIAAACPVCYGASDSPMADGVKTAILVLLGITGSVLTGFAAFFLHLRKRARMTLHNRFDLTSVN